MRLVFGASTAANAAVLAIFMGGLGIGGAVLGPRADRTANALRFYGFLETAIAATAFLTPLLLWAVRWAYLTAGGAGAMGTLGATVARLALSALVLGVPTVLMGGTLPAIVRAMEGKTDQGRRRVAWLYGANTLGAVTGALVVTFWLLEQLGARQSLWLACLANAFIAFTALALAARQTPGHEFAAPINQPSADRAAPLAFIYAAAAVVGFAYFLMELVWYRMLAPILGGSTYTFGLILAVALLGIGLGGLAYGALAGRRQATLGAFAGAVGLEGLLIAVPFALGDWIAVWTALLRPWDLIGFYGLVFGWAVITAVVVLPPSLVAGYQFPMLISLLGQGRDSVGRHTGRVYAWNTFGAVAGALTGGFGFIPLLTAPGAWRASVLLLLVLAVIATVLAARTAEARGRIVVAAALASVAVVLVLLPRGPTAFWRHSGIGVGWVDVTKDGPNDLRDRIHTYRQNLKWEWDGVESSVGVMNSDSLAFVVNGKVDGNAVGDATTQVMMGMVSAIVHPNPRNALVVGLGTGSSAGWLAAIDSMEQVDAVELEPAVVEFARQCDAVNKDALENPKVNVIIGDGREVLMTGEYGYDLIVSAPSNPYRAGIASMYTQEFYSAVAHRLTEGGYFSQWLQAYDVDGETIQTVYATLASVFPYVTTWQTNTVDLLLVCSMHEPLYDIGYIRHAAAREPFRSALLNSWRAKGAETFLGRYVANPDFARHVAKNYDGALNSDDRMLLEYGFARTLNTTGLFSIEELYAAARTLEHHRPNAAGSIDWNLVDYRRSELYSLDDAPPPLQFVPDAYRNRTLAHAHHVNNSIPSALRIWEDAPLETPLEIAMAAHAYAGAGDDRALRMAEELETFRFADAAGVRAHYFWRAGNWAAAVEHLNTFFQRYRETPWTTSFIAGQALMTAKHIGVNDKGLAPEILEAIGEPFAVDALQRERMLAALDIAYTIDITRAVPYFEYFEPDPPWLEAFLERRYAAYAKADHPFTDRAQRDLAAFLRAERRVVNWTFDEGP